MSRPKQQRTTPEQGQVPPGTFYATDAETPNSAEMVPPPPPTVPEFVDNTKDTACPTQKVTKKLPGSDGRYELRQLLGKGGMGEVYLAHDNQLDRSVALKFPILNEEEGDTTERFFREARAAAQLRHPCICPVYDVGLLDGALFLSMAYIEGKPLSDRLKQEHQLPVPEAVALTRTIALAMAEAHRLGIIHRDLKPANIMLDAQGQPIIMDFGLARRVPTETCSGDKTLTHSGTLMGTPTYMAPEQARGDPHAMGQGCDIYSLGVIFFEMLTGRPPFQADSMLKLLVLVQDFSPPRPTLFRPDLDPRLEAICLKTLAKTPQERFASMTEFAAALAPFAPTNGMGGDTAVQKKDKPVRSRRRWVIPTGLVCLLLLGAGVAYYGMYLNHGGEENSQELAQEQVQNPNKQDSSTPKTVTPPSEPQPKTSKQPEPLSKPPETAPPLQPTPEQKRAAQIAAQAEQFLKEGNPDQAIARAEEALKLDPNSVPALLARADGFLFKEFDDEAIQGYTNVLKLDMKNEKAYAFRGFAHQRKMNFDASIADATEALKLNSKNVTALLNRACAYVNKKEPEKCIADVTEALKLKPGVTTAHFDRAVSYLYLGEYNQALRDLNMVVQLQPEDYKGYWWRAALLSKMGAQAQAQEDHNRAVQLNSALATQPLLALPNPIQK